MKVIPASALQLTAVIGGLVFSIVTLYLPVRLGCSTLFHLVRRDSWAKKGFDPGRMAGWKPSVVAMVDSIENRHDRGRFAYDISTGKRTQIRRSQVAMFGGLTAGFGAGAMLGARFAPSGSNQLVDVLLAITIGGVIGMWIGIGTSEAINRVGGRSDALLLASTEVGFVLDLKAHESRYWRRYNRLTHIKSLKKAFDRAEIPTDDLTTPGLPELDYDADWDRLKDRALTLLARAYLGDFLMLPAPTAPQTSRSRTERVTNILALVAGSVAVVYSVAQLLGLVLDRVS